MIHPKRFEEIKASRNLPSPSGVAVKVLRLTESEESKADDIASTLQADPALAGRILKYANSAYVGATRPVAALRDAVARLGTKTVRRLALGFSLISQDAGGQCHSFNHRQYWSRCLATAIAAQIVCRHTRRGNTEEIFIGGLLSDVGSLALATMHPDAYDEVLRHCQGKSFVEQLRLERLAFAMDQVDLTVAMLEDWGLPEEYVHAVRCLGAWEAGGQLPDGSNDLAAQLFLARRLALYCADPTPERAREAAALLESRALEIDRAAFPLLAEQVTHQWQQWGKLFGLPTGDVPSLLTTANRLDQLKRRGSGERGRFPLRILLAEDDPTALEQLTHELHKAGHEVVTAGNGERALQLALEAGPQVVLAGSALPGLSGIDFCRLLRKTQAGQKVYVIYLARRDDAEEVVAALDAGADDYCIKPCNPRVLLARLRAGQRAIDLQRALEREKEEVRQFVAQLAVANRQLERQANTDALTGLPNRAFARECLESALRASAKDGTSLACLMIDIDHFKQINDTYGHDVGDLVLQRTAAALSGSVRSVDVVCRLGGEEFLLICKKAGLEEGRLVAERVRANVAANRIKAPGFEGAVTVSIGLAVWKSGMAHPDELLKAADVAVYAAKRSGRNRVCCAGEEPPAEAVQEGREVLVAV